jgi:hypothetical protein
MFSKRELQKEIVCFFTDGVEKQTLKPIFDEAIKRGYTAKFSDNIHEKAEIGIYCQHSCFPQNSRFSMILLHDLDQGHNRWPDIWKLESWCFFDIGILPGPAWAERWQLSSNNFYANPRMGTFMLGWPKSDSIVNSHALQREKLDALSKELNLKHHNTILYAPSWENDGKQDEFVQKLRQLPVNLLLKQAPWSQELYPGIVTNIEEMNALHTGRYENVHVLSREIDIFTCLSLADIIVSDESGVMTEGLLTQTPAIAVLDWTIPDRKPPRFAEVNAPHIIRTTREGLATCVAQTLDGLDDAQKQLSENKERTFSNLGNASSSILDILDSVIENRELPFEPIENRSMYSRIPLSYRVWKYLRFLRKRRKYLRALNS